MGTPEKMGVKQLPQSPPETQHFTTDPLKLAVEAPWLMSQSLFLGVVQI